MQISVEARATGRDNAQASVVIETPPAATSAELTRGRITRFVATTVAIAGAITSLPELSVRLPARVVMALHLIATVGTSAQPLVVTVAAAMIAVIAERRRRYLNRASEQ